MSSVFMVGVDCSECGNRAIDYAAKQAKKANAKLYVAHVIEWSPYTFSTLEENAQRHKQREEELQRAHAEIVDPVVKKLQADGIAAEALLRHGHVAETLQDLASEHGVSNIIIGRQGASMLKAHVFGSVGSRLVQVADCAVTVVP